MTDYEQIKTTCLQKRELWEDPDFPATQSSVFYHQTPPFHFEWIRAKDIYTNPSFILSNCDTFDVSAGKLGDKWMVSCLGILYLSKALFYRVVPADQKINSSYAGVFRFRLWWCGQWMEVLVDDRLPTVNGKLAFLQTTETQQLWPALLEKAYAKLHGSYEALKYGGLLDGLADLTGGITESIPIAYVTALSDLAQMLKLTSVVTAHYFPTCPEDHLNGMEMDLNYRIYEVAEVQSANGVTHLVRLQRPDDAPATHCIPEYRWKMFTQADRDRIGNRGCWILFSAFLKSFHCVEAVHLDSETSWAETSLKDKQKWKMKIHQGKWRRGVSAGGCRNYTSFFHANPQIQLILNEPDTVIISLNQHSIMEPKVIGFSIYKLPKHLTETAPSSIFQKIRSIMNSQYTNSRQVSHRCELEDGAYIIVPTTFEPRQEAHFTLRIFSTKNLKMNVLDSPPQMLKAALVKAPPALEMSSFSQYEAVFLQLADEHRTLNAFELQELLDACLPNDYIKSCASIDTCKQIVLTMDKKFTGRITLSDFKDLMCSLKIWQLVFKSHAREKMGVLRAERFRDALHDVGFLVPECVLALLVLRYMRKDGMLRFGDFVSAVLHLHRAFDVYHSNLSLRSENVNLNLSEWLKFVLIC